MLRSIAKTALVASAMAAGLTVSTEARELKLATAGPEKSPWGQFAFEVAEKVAEVSDGKLTIQVFPGGQLGNEQVVIRQVVRGRIDMSANSNTATGLIAPEFALLAAPYLWKNHAKADCVADEHLLDVYGPLLEENGLVALTWVEVGWQIIFAKEPIRHPEQLANIKLRVAPTPTDTLYMNEVGANAVPIGTAESMPALKTGLVEAVTWPIVYGFAVGYDKVTPHVTLTQHAHQLGSLTIGKRIWDSLSDEEKAWLREGTQLAGFLRKRVRDAETAMVAKAEQDGATIHRLTDDERAAWAAKAPAAQEKIIEEVGGRSRELWNRIQEAKAACAG